jgi:hypothetical protein
MSEKIQKRADVTVSVTVKAERSINVSGTTKESPFMKLNLNWATCIVLLESLFWNWNTKSFCHMDPKGTDKDELKYLEVSKTHLQK